MLNKEFPRFAAGIHVPCIDGDCSAVPSFFLKPDYGDSMNKTELVEIVAKEADLSKAAAASALDAVIAAIVTAVSKGDTATLIGFGTFKPSKRAARTGRNPQTGNELKIAATTVPRFTAGAGFKAAVAGKKAAKKK
jgi:DNA-binding protein HU-beta